jgi:O-antigen ligase
MSVVGIIQGILGVEVNASYVDLLVNEGMPGRVYAMFENPNAFAEVLALLIPLAVGLCLGSPRWGGRILGAGAAGLGIGAIFMTYSRASWVGLAVAALLFVFLWNRKLLPAVLLLGLATIPILPDAVFNRILTIFNTHDTSTTSRFPLYAAALRLLGARPLTGAGLGTDAVRQAVGDLNLYHGVAPFVHSHDVYLQVWAETGVFGLLSFVGAMGWSIKNAMAAAASKACPRAVRLLTIGGASALAGILVCGLADYIWNYPRVMVIFWFVAAVTLSGIRLYRRAGQA